MKQKWMIHVQCFLAFFSFSYVSTQLIPLFTNLEIPLHQRGYILSGIAIVSTISQMMVGLLCDRYHQIKRFFLLGYIVMIASSVVLFRFINKRFFYLLLIGGIVGGFAKMLQGLMETYLFESDEKQYAKIRSSGAIGFTIGALCAGRIVEWSSFSMLVIPLLFISVLWYIFFHPLKDVEMKGNYSLKQLQALFQNKRYLAYVCLFFLIYFIGNGDQFIVVDKMVQLKATHDEIAMKWALQSIMEVPLLLGAGWLLSKVKEDRLLLLAIIAYAIKFFLYGFIQEPIWIIATTSLQIVTLPIVSLVSKIMISKICEEDMKNTAQMFAMAIFVGLSGLFTPLVSSPLVDWLGYDHALYVFAFANIIPLCLLFILRKKLTAD